MIRVWIAQCLCPQRHCILAASGEVDGEAEAEIALTQPLRYRVASLIRERTLNPWCGICRATLETWTFEVGRTRWETLGEAMTELKRIEAEQVATGVTFGELLGKRGFDA